jgi:hypothetical protein
MSSSRSIAAARQRRGVESAPPTKTNNYVASNNYSSNKDNFNNNSQGRVNYRTTKSNIHQDNNQQNTNNTNSQISKLSVSDAFALVTLRLGRLELIMNKLQGEGILDANNNINSDKVNAGSNNFDDTILQNIITRLDGLDKKTISNDLNQKLQSQFNFLNDEVKETKNMMIRLQSFIMDISQKLNSFISNQESINANQDSINEEFFDLRDNVENNKVVLDNLDTIQGVNLNGPLGDSFEEVGEKMDEINENVDDVVEEKQTQEVLEENIISEIGSTELQPAELVETTSSSRKNKNNRNKSMNINL